MIKLKDIENLFSEGAILKIPYIFLSSVNKFVYKYSNLEEALKEEYENILNFEVDDIHSYQEDIEISLKPGNFLYTNATIINQKNTTLPDYIAENFLDVIAENLDADYIVPLFLPFNETEYIENLNNLEKETLKNKKGKFIFLLYFNCSFFRIYNSYKEEDKKNKSILLKNKLIFDEEHRMAYKLINV